MSSVSLMMSSGGSWRLAPKEWPTPRHISHLRSETVCSTSYSGVRKSQCCGDANVRRLRRAGIQGHASSSNRPPARTNDFDTTPLGGTPPHATGR